MKKVDYEHFSRFLFPMSLKEHEGKLYFLIRKADMQKNKYTTDLYRFEDGEAVQLTSSGDVSDYWFGESGIIFPSLRKDEDRLSSKEGAPLCVLQLLPYKGGEAREFLRLDYNINNFAFVDDKHFYFTATYSFDYEAALSKAEGDRTKALKLLGEDEDYQVIDELPFWSNGSGFTNKLRRRLYYYGDGDIRSISDEYANVYINGLSDDKNLLYYVAESHSDVMEMVNQAYQVDAQYFNYMEIRVKPDLSYSKLIPLKDGTLLAFATDASKFGLCTNDDVYRRAPGERKFTTIYDKGDHNFYNSCGSDIKMGMGNVKIERDGKLYLLDTQTDSGHLVALDTTSGEVTNVSRERGSITDAVEYEGGFAIIALRGNNGCELYKLELDGSEKRLSSLNSGLCAEYEYSAPIDLSFVNENGVEIGGWVIPPVGMEAGKKYPTILDIHGGPKTVYGNCYFHEMQLWAGRGYAVIFCNPTGSDGRGNEFSDLRGKYGTVDYRDIMSFTEKAAKSFDFIDPCCLGVTGGSYGGFMTNWIIGHTHIFRAAASQRSISNWLSFMNLSDIGYYFDSDQQAAGLWDNPEKLWWHSPVQYANKAVTPTLFIHSDQDYRCNLEEGIQMFAALKLNNVPARMCIFHGENHELSRSGKPKHRVRRLREITEWFDKYLKEEEQE